MSYTLISMIGTGMYKTANNSEGYKETEYFFDNGKKFKTRLFMQALLECKYKPIDQLIILGTDTSSWDCLVDKDNDERDETITLWDSLFDQCEKKENEQYPIGVTRENLDRLEKYLSERFCINVSILTHTHSIDDSSSEELFTCYTDATSRVKKENNILFDITHGFRSMPVLMYQSLQFSAMQDSNRTIEIVYGELDLQNQSKAVARSLNSYWHYSELSAAKTVFRNKLDGFRLSELISQEWPRGSKAIKRFSEIVQSNFSLQILDVVPQIKNAINDCPAKNQSYLIQVKEDLQQIVNIVDENSIPKTLFNYSKFLYEHKLNVQAVITLQVAVESAIVTAYGIDENLGDYDWWQEAGRKYLNKLKGEDWKNLGNPLTNLEVFRNQIAHGGGKNKDGYFPQAANIPNIYESGKRGVENLFKKLNL